MVVQKLTGPGRKTKGLPSFMANLVTNVCNAGESVFTISRGERMDREAPLRGAKEHGESDLGNEARSVAF